MRSRQGVLIDTSAFGALFDRRDARHQTAQTIAARMAVARQPLFTTNFVVAETHALLIARLNRDDAERFLQSLDDGPVSTIRVSEDDERTARQIIRRYRDKDFSLVDALSFAVMERQRVGHAFTFDRHFAQYGFALIDVS